VASFNQGRIRRINTEFRGDEALELEILEVMLRMGEVARTRIESDTKLVRLALRALDCVIAEHCARTGQRYPSYTILSRYLDERNTAAPAEPTRVVSMQK
jgi:hypothetical protein